MIPTFRRPRKVGQPHFAWARSQNGEQDEWLRWIAGGLGGFGGFHKKKKQQEQEQRQAAAQSAAQQKWVVLMESSTETTNFSSAAIDSSQFNVPAGYTKVPSVYEKGQQ